MNKIAQIENHSQANYNDAYLVSKSVIGYGSLIKGIGITIGILILLASLGIGQHERIVILVGLVIAVTIGGFFYAVGILIAAIGQMLNASLDTAVNTSVIKEIYKEFMAGTEENQKITENKRQDTLPKYKCQCGVEYSKEDLKYIASSKAGSNGECIYRCMKCGSTFTDNDVTSFFQSQK